MIDILPVLWLLILCDFVITPFSGPFPIMAAAFAALSVLGFIKLLHAIITTENHRSIIQPMSFIIMWILVGAGR